MLDYLDEIDIEYVVGLSNWPALQKRAKKAQRLTLREYKTRGQTTQIFGETQYRTKQTWPHPRHVLFKAEVVDYPGRAPRQNLRFLVTNFKMTAKRAYRFYCLRGRRREPDQGVEARARVGTEEPKSSRSAADSAKVSRTLNDDKKID